MVWPIRRMQTNDGALEPDVLGFLCVDSGARGVFNRRYDFEIGAAFADVLYVYILRQRTGKMEMQRTISGGTR